MIAQNLNSFLYKVSHLSSLFMSSPSSALHSPLSAAFSSSSSPRPIERFSFPAKIGRRRPSCRGQEPRRRRTGPVSRPRRGDRSVGGKTFSALSKVSPLVRCRRRCGQRVSRTRGQLPYTESPCFRLSKGRSSPRYIQWQRCQEGGSQAW